MNALGRLRILRHSVHQTFCWGGCGVYRGVLLWSVYLGPKLQTCKNVGLFVPEIAMPLLNRMMILYCWIRCYCDSDYNHIDDCKDEDGGWWCMYSYIHPSWQDLTKKWGRDKQWRLQITQYLWHSSRVSLPGIFRNVCGIWHCQPGNTKV